ncbi:MAG: hypothetical protein HKN52_00180 [Eudoraea sp.]|nr:hypothetical protein [Muriicola sp.]NNE01554.1 hypothetical protein [Eudoraea sp.]
MRTTRVTQLLIMLFVISPFMGISQDMSKSQAFWVHEDVVKPSMVAEYEEVCKDLVGNMKTHNIQETAFIVSSTVDNRYLYISPLNNMADLDKPVFATLAEKMGGDAMSALFARMDKCYDIEHDYVINLEPELSYMPGGITLTPEGQDYRKFHYLHISPGNRAVVKEKMKAVKAMFASKGSKTHYRVYSSGFGTRGEFYLVAVAAKDPVDYAQKGMENNALLGEDGQKTMMDLFSNLLDYEEIAGSMRPDMAYAPSN